ncbi:hypothetical protein N7493_007267 [Penicillium malachiteum]|uniref:Uncharacterized protein n=1 Tax=Penicillium malachiteum TaxID=1324776 RepID=A0AAD6HJ72_9EURO|nr:hypothetical protein N7493_007267 [Penicillium malachiteum]
MSTSIVVRDPLTSAAAWIGGSGRPYTELVIESNQNKWARQGTPCGITCTLAQNVRIQIRYDYDGNHGFHVDAYKNEQHRVYVWEGNRAGTNVAIADYTRALEHMNNTYISGGQESVATAFLSGRREI